MKPEHPEENPRNYCFIDSKPKDIPTHTPQEYDSEDGGGVGGLLILAFILFMIGHWMGFY